MSLIVFQTLCLMAAAAVTRMAHDLADRAGAR